MGYDWDEYLNDRGDILRGEDPRLQEICDQQSEISKDIYEFADSIISIGTRLKQACDQLNTDKMRSLIEDVDDWSLPDLIAKVDEIDELENMKFDL